MIFRTRCGLSMSCNISCKKCQKLWFNLRAKAFRFFYLFRTHDILRNLCLKLFKPYTKIYPTYIDRHTCYLFNNRHQFCIQSYPYKYNVYTKCWKAVHTCSQSEADWGNIASNSQHHVALRQVTVRLCSRCWCLEQDTESVFNLSGDDIVIFSSCSEIEKWHYIKFASPFVL